jgi:hypothetical protein
MTKFQNIQHFFLHEQRPQNRLNGKITSHPFACIAVGFDPSIPDIPFRVAVAVCHPKDNMIRKVGAQKAVGLLHASSDGTHAHVKWFKPSEVKTLGSVLTSLGVDRAMKERDLQLTRGSKTLKMVIADIQGLRIFKPKTKAKAKATVGACKTAKA